MTEKELPIDKKVSISPLKINGILHIPELNFFIPSPLDSDISIHALGGLKHTYEGIWHGILSRDCAYHATVIGVIHTLCFLTTPCCPYQERVQDWQYLFSSSSTEF